MVLEIEDYTPKENWLVHTARLPKSLTQVPLLRMISCNGEAWVVEVIDVAKKRGRIIAECDPDVGNFGPYFSCYSDHPGHVDLCRHLESCGIGGHYKRYLSAIERGEDELAQELAGMAMVRFSTRLTDDKIEDWEIDESFVKFKDKVEDDAEEEQEEEAEEGTKIFGLSEAQIRRAALGK